MQLARSFPDQYDVFLKQGIGFQHQLQSLRREHAPPAKGWYPFDSLSSFSAVAGLIAPHFSELSTLVKQYPMLDLGCGDGDYSLLFATMGAQVHAVDKAESNYNGMEGVRILSQTLQVPIVTCDKDLDRLGGWGTQSFSLCLFLGTLYHLKNPYGVLEQLAFHSRWCVVSTRVARVTPRTQSNVEAEPVAYLADGREIANDATNYWIFSPAGLLRVLQRTRWAVISQMSLGCSSDSTPTDPERDERMFVVLKSRVFYPDLQVLLLDGFYPAEEDTWMWTASEFAVQIILPLEKHLTAFALDLFVPDVVVASCSLSVAACIDGVCVGTASSATGGILQISGSLPEFALHSPVLIVRFTVDSDWEGPATPDNRDLGVCVPLDIQRTATSGLRFDVL